MTANPTVPLLPLLRAATRASHERMHQNPLLVQLLGDTARRCDLIDVLRRFQRFYGACEPAMNRSGHPGFEFEATPLAWLEEDLRHLGAVEPDTGTPGRIIPAPPGRAHRPRAIETLESYLAYLYLKQGSSLGGQLIARRLHANGVLAEAETCAFFTGYGQATGRHWQAFQAFLETFAGEVDPRALQRHAAAHFAHLETCFSIPAIDPPVYGHAH